MSSPSHEPGRPVGLPDFLDPSDVVDASFEASTTWGSDAAATSTPPRADDASTHSPGRERSTRRGSTGGRRGRAATKPTLTWAQKQQRREQRAERRRAQEAADRAQDPVGFAREIVLTQLTSAPRTRAQLAEKLRAKEVSEDVIETVLDRMEDVGLVDDAAYAGMLVRSQLASRGLARRALARELQRKGIEGDVAAEALEQVDDDAERARAQELARKKLATMSRLDEATRTRRLAGMLARKGYPPALVWSVVKDVQGSFDPDEAL